MRQQVLVWISDGTKENEQQHPGTLIENETGLYLFYGTGEKKNRLEVSRNQVKLLRPEGICKKMEIVFAEYRPFEIKSPYGTLTLETHGKALEVEKRGREREIRLEYDITSEKEVQDERHLCIRITPTEGESQGIPPDED